LGAFQKAGRHLAAGARGRAEMWCLRTDPCGIVCALMTQGLVRARARAAARPARGGRLA